MRHSCVCTLALLLACGTGDAPGATGDSSGIDLSAGDLGTSTGRPSDDGDAMSGAPDPAGTLGSGGDDTTGKDDGAQGTSTGNVGSDTGVATLGFGEDDSGSSTTMGCPSTAVEFEPLLPTVVLLVDQSGSMTSSFAGVPRWNAVRDALTDPVTGVVANLEDDVRFGLSLYTSHNGFGNSGTNECPILTEVAPAVGNYTAIDDTFDGASPDSETPTGESIEAVTAALVADTDPNPKIIVLATDGEPDTCAQPNPQNGQDEAIEAAEAAFAAGIQTFIISVGSDISESHLQDMANAGVGWMPGDEDAPFYVPSDQDALAAAFDEIINGVRSCVLTLSTPILPGHYDDGTVTINGAEIPFEDADGWQVNSATEIELLGAACDLIQEGDVEITVEFSCDAIIPQ
jgi:hypothetical protein